MSGDLELGRLIDPPDYTITVTSDDMAGILNVIEEALMRTDDFIDMDYGKYLRESTRQALYLRRDDIRELLDRLVRAQSKAERAALDGLDGLDDASLDAWHARDLEFTKRTAR